MATGSVLDRLASALGRRDERPNVELAEALSARPDAAAIGALVDALTVGSRPVRHDAIKVLYELGERRPELVAGQAEAFLDLLETRDNRMLWGALSALAAIARHCPDVLAARLNAIIAAADRGSVIARDKTMTILALLVKAGRREATPLLLDRLETAAPNQFPMYAEIAATAVDMASSVRLREILVRRLPGIPQPAKRRRVEKTLRQISVP